MLEKPTQDDRRTVRNDLLSEVLRLVHLTGAMLFELDVTGQWGIAGHSMVERLARLLPSGTSDMIIFYVVLEGDCWVRLASTDWLSVPAGHTVVMTHGQGHELCDLPGRKTTPFEALLDGRPLSNLRHLRLENGPGGTTRLLCGILGCDRRAFDPLCLSLPPMFQVDMGGRMQTLIPYAVANALDDSPGAAALREHLAELLFLAAVRVHMCDLPDEASGWLAGLRDPAIGRALRALHAQPSRHWSVDELAEAAASSRSVLAARFTEMLGEAPMHYLTRLRMSLAARQLTDSHKSLATIAQEVGYESPAAFQRAFKHHFHVPPAAWRRGAGRAGAGVW